MWFFKKKNSLVVGLHRTYTRALTFENVFFSKKKPLFLWLYIGHIPGHFENVFFPKKKTLFLWVYIGHIPGH
jgi:hypothetical protein